MKPPELQVYEVIACLMAQHGYPPTLAEIGAACGHTKNWAWRHVQKLKQRGVIVGGKGRAARALWLVG